jgi:hypothetical protein
MTPARSKRPVAQPWSEAELARLRALRAEGRSHDVTAGILRQEFGTERSRAAVQMAAWAIRSKEARDADRDERQAEREVAAANTSNRRCLTCGGGFASWGAGNRMCGPCRHTTGTW